MDPSARLARPCMRHLGHAKYELCMHVARLPALSIVFFHLEIHRHPRASLPPYVVLIRQGCKDQQIEFRPTARALGWEVARCSSGLLPFESSKGA